MYAVLEALGSKIESTINCMVLGKIVDVKTESMMASARPLLRVGGATQPSAMPYMPMVVLRGGQSYLSMPVRAGDPCLIIICDNEIDGAIDHGEPAEPESRRRHDLMDGFILTGFFPLSSVPEIETGHIQMADPKQISLSTPSVKASGSLEGELHSTNGYSGTFTAGNRTITVVDGIITEVA